MSGSEMREVYNIVVQGEGDKYLSYPAGYLMCVAPTRSVQVVRGLDLVLSPEDLQPLIAELQRIQADQGISPAKEVCSELEGMD